MPVALMKNLKKKYRTKMILSVIAVFYVLHCSLVSKAETFSSVFHLTNLLQNRLLEERGYQLEFGNKNSKSVEDLVNKSGMSIQQLSEHPVAAFHVMKCLTASRELKKELQGDLEGAALSLVRLQESYDLDINEMMNGRILHYGSNFSFTVEDCLMVAHQAFFDMRLEAAENWLTSCTAILATYVTNSTTFTVNSREKAASSVFHNRVKELKEYISWIKSFKGSPSKIRKILTLFPEFSQAAQEMLTVTDDVKQLKRNLTANTNLLCQGYEPPWVRKTRKGCILRRHPSMYQPILTEYVNDEPAVIIYHKIISTKEMEQLKSMASERLETSRIHRFSDGKVEQTTGRVGKMAWLSRGYHELIERLYKRTEQVTGLSTKTAEDLQIMNYGMGGHYENHMDFFDVNRRGIKLETGDRIATVLFYLNKVEHGGETVFSELGISVTPTEGSAITWYNLDTDGLGDYRTLHAACPVVIGTKWVANLWLHEREQEFRRPCLKR